MAQLDKSLRVARLLALQGRGMLVEGEKAKRERGREGFGKWQKERRLTEREKEGFRKWGFKKGESKKKEREKFPTNFFTKTRLKKTFNNLIILILKSKIKRESRNIT